MIAVKEAGANTFVQAELLNDITAELCNAKEALKVLENKLSDASKITDQKERAFYFKDVICVAMADLRTPVDTLETMVDKKSLPMPTYADLMFEV